MKKEEEIRTLKTLDRAVEIIDILQERGGARLTPLAEELDMDPSTLYRYLVTLQENEYVVREEDVYYPSLKFVDIAWYVQTRKEAYGVADSYTERVVDETGCRSVFVTEEHGRGVYISANFGEYASWQHTHIGHRCSLHDRAGGKAILAHLPDERVEQIIDRHGLDASTENTITDRTELFEELERIRERGVSFNREEQIEGIRAVGAPILVDDTVIGAITAGGSVNRLKGDWFEEELPDILLGIATEFELDISLS